MVNAFLTISREILVEKQMTDFFHSHLHTEYSILDGNTKVDEVLQTAQALGQRSVAITDHGSLAASYQFYNKAKEYEVKPVFGIEGYISDDINQKDKEKEIYHLILLAMNRQGLENLFAISKIGWTKGFYRKPCIDHKVLRQHNEGLICTSSCMAGEVARAIERERIDEAIDILAAYKAIFGDRFYVELQPGNTRVLNYQLAELANKLAIKTTVAVDSHYCHHDDKSTEELLLTMQQVTSMKASDRKAAEFNYEYAKNQPNLIERLKVLWPNKGLSFVEHDLFIMSRQEVQERMDAQGFNGAELCDRTLEIAERCDNVELVRKENYLPKVFEDENSFEKLKVLAYQGLIERSKKLKSLVSYRERLDYELGIIKDKNFADYFLIIWDVINEARKRDIYTGPGRGSVAGSLLAWCLSITALDPIKYNLVFERFISPERTEFPDIDLDIEDRRREELKAYIEEKYGESVSISTFTTLAGKSVIRSIGRALAIPLNEIDEVCKRFKDLDDFESDATLEFRAAHPEVAQLAQKLQGHISASGMHAAAVVVANRPLEQILPIESRTNPEDKKTRVPVTAYAMDDVAAVGLIKFDFLGLNTLSVIHDAVDLIKQRHGVTVDWENLEPDDPETLAALCAGHTTGIFQMESGPYRKLLAAMKGDTFEDLIASNALVRPGAFNSVAPEWIKRKHGKKVETLHEDVDGDLAATYGLVVYQESVMQLAHKLAGFSWEKSYKFLKLMAKKKDVEEFKPYYDSWMEGATEKVGKKKAQQLWDDMEQWANYGFSRNHSAPYTFLGYVTGYLKLHYPLEYLYGLLRAEKKDMPRMTYLLEARRLGINLLAPDVNISEATISIDGDALRFGLEDIKGVGPAAAQEIINKRPYESFEDFETKVEKRKCNARVVEALLSVDAFATIKRSPRNWNPESNYLERLSYPIGLENLEIAVDFTPLEEYEEPDYAIICAIVKSVKRTDRYVRVDFEDTSGTVTVFADMENDLSSGEMVLALIGDKSLVNYARVRGLNERLATDVANEFERYLVSKDIWDPYSLLFKYGFGGFESDKTLALPIKVKTLTTKAGQKMGLVYFVDINDVVGKTITWAKEWPKVRARIKEWKVVALRPVFKGSDMTVYADGIIDADEVLEMVKKKIGKA